MLRIYAACIRASMWTGSISSTRLCGGTRDAELFDLEAEMYGDLLSMYEKGDSTVETKCPGDGTEGES